MIAAIALAALLGGLVAFQLALALGAPVGRAAYGGYVARPGTRLRVASLIAAALWSAAAVVVIAREHTGWLIWVVVGLLGLGIVANAITRSRVERAIWLPFSLVATALAVVVALG